MAKMMALANPGENHKLLAQLDGKWKFTMKFWMAPGMPPSESDGTSVRKPEMSGRYFLTDATGKVQMPGPDGKMKDMEFKGMGIDGYDNVKQKFISTWIDNMGTSIEMLEGTYDPSTKTFTYHTEEEPAPGVKIKARELIKLVDANHWVLEWYEDHGGEETKTLEISYTRQE